MSALFSKKEKDKDDVKAQKVAEAQDTSSEMVQAVGGLALPQSGDSQAYHYILSPHVTEKASIGNALNKYTFKVSKDSNKIEIKKAIEKLYKVKVVSVHIQKIPSKTRQVGRYIGKKAGIKKAIITLKEGQKIEVV